MYLSRQFCRVSLGSRRWQYWELHWLPGCQRLITCVTSSVRAHRRCMLCGYWELKACRMKLFRLYSGQSSSANCYMCLVRGAVLSPTLIGSTSTHSCSEVNAVDFVHRTCRGSTNYLKMPTLLCFIKSPLTVVMSCISFYRHFRRPHRTIVCVIELISSACRTTQDALWIVTFLLGPCLRTFINSF